MHIVNKMRKAEYEMGMVVVLLVNKCNAMANGNQCSLVLPFQKKSDKFRYAKISLT